MFYIYRLTDGEQDYYGQTQDCKHRLKNHKNTSQLCMSRLLNKNNMKLHVLHTLYTKQEADETEQFYILNMKCVNKAVPCRTRKEWRQDNKEKLKVQVKEYYQNNKDKIHEYYNDNKEKKKEYYNDNKDKISEYRKEWYQNNKDKLTEQRKEYYQENKDKIKEYRDNNKEKLQQKFNCECGGKYTYHHKSRHLKSNKHQNYING